jgi:co-chaperonin GroES (HSP10)
MKVKGKIIPIKDNVIVSDMEFGMQTTKAGIVLTSDNGKAEGIYPRWGRVWAIGPEQTDVQVGEWVLVEHGRWGRTVELELNEDDIIELRRVDTKAILATADEKPEGWMRRA